MRKFFVISFLMVLLLPIMSGCWNQKELTDLAFVMAMGIDKGEDKKFDVSFQLVNPGNVASGQNGGGQGLPIAVYKSSGNTITEAARNATKMISRRLYYSHTNLIAVSEEVARDGILDMMDALDRDPEFRTTTQIVVARHTSAQDLVSALTNLDKLPVNKITKELKSTEKMLGENIGVNIDDFLAGLVSDGKNPIVNGYIVHGKKEQIGNAQDLQKTIGGAFLEADGLAVFEKGKLIGWFEHQWARGVVYVLDKVQSTGINVSWNGKKHAITMASIRSKTKVSVHFKNGKPLINIAIEDEGWISEANTAVDLTNPQVIDKIDKLVEKEIKRQVLGSIKEAQKMKSDIFGFGERVHRANPKQWKKLKGDWNNHFAELDVNVKVDSFVRREGIRTSPFWINMNK
ncbi:Ger(x)C family spore germination protein [Neobacillus soli]|uniref:Ger(x)C family spore germination protein n=1 Tax=Neobacillus soli TaxID=220688 RepID=UPI0008240573|nr:Ger(x)C family spore germination protein [Neobacillus soli]